MPPTFPLSSYTGTYHHPGYKTLTIYLAPPDPLSNASINARTYTLRADRSETILCEQLTFEHVSGEFFIAKSKHLEDFGVLFDDVYPVVFRIGPDGRVVAVGIRWEESMGEEKIWMQRVLDSSDLVR